MRSRARGVWACHAIGGVCLNLRRAAVALLRASLCRAGRRRTQLRQLSVVFAHLEPVLHFVWFEARFLTPSFVFCSFLSISPSPCILKSFVSFLIALSSLSSSPVGADLSRLQYAAVVISDMCVSLQVGGVFHLHFSPEEAADLIFRLKLKSGTMSQSFIITYIKFSCCTVI